MSPNKKVVEKLGEGIDRLDRETMLSCLADDVERIEWLDGNPNSGVPIRGKDAFIQNMDRPADVIMKSETKRMTEENNVVVAESIVRLTKKDGSVFATIKAIDVMELENGKIKRIDAFTAEIKNSA